MRIQIFLTIIMSNYCLIAFHSSDFHYDWTLLARGYLSSRLHYLMHIEPCVQPKFIELSDLSSYYA